MGFDVRGFVARYLSWLFLVVVLLLGVCVGAYFYRWWVEEERRRFLIYSVYAFADVPLGELGDLDSTLGFLLSTNASSDVLRLQVSVYFHDVRFLSYLSIMLHALTGDRKYEVFGLAMNNLKLFLVKIKGSSDVRSVLEVNFRVLCEIAGVFRVIGRMKYLTLAEAERLLELSKMLRYA